MNVYVIEVGNVDSEHDMLASIWETEEAAINAARATVNELLVDLNWDVENGYSTSERRCDDGDYLFTIENAEGHETDWWVISKHHVLCLK
jgi:hypothetical protein